jgi:hypothetical protein
MFRCRQGNSVRRPLPATAARIAARIAALIAATLAASATTAGAQLLTGTVRDSISRVPVPGAVVVLLDSAGAPVARNLTNERGEYHVMLRDAIRSMRLVRIGFEPREFPLASRTEASERLDVSMAPIPNMVQPIRVVANSRCRPRKDRAEALGLWEQARAALLAAVVAREENPAKILRLGFDRVMDGNSDRIEMMRVSADSEEMANATFIAAHEAKDFVRFGFSTDSFASGTYFGPDADVLLNESFAGAYCFELAGAGRARANQVGLRFLPADSRRGRVDIDGTLWIDTAARELRDVEYRYLHVQRNAAAFHPGGTISFRSMKNGVVFIDRWSIRMVSAEEDTTIEANGRPRLHDWLYAEEDGGELARATWLDGLTWHAPLGTLRLHAITKDGKSVPGVVLSLVATGYFGTTDVNGVLEIRDLLPGPYAVRIVDPRIAALGVGLPTPLKFRAARDTTALASVVVQNAESYLADRCVANHHWTVGDSLFTIGRVVTPNGKPVNGAKVTFSSGMRDGRPVWNRVYYMTGTDGLFEFCHEFAPGTEVVYRVSRNGASDVTTTRRFDERLQVVKIVVQPVP